MGAAVCAAVRADPDLELVAAVDPAYAGTVLDAAGMVAAPGPEALAAAGAEVAVDFHRGPSRGRQRRLVRRPRCPRCDRYDGAGARRPGRDG